METNVAIGVQILDKAVCVSLGANAFGKGINPSLLPAAIDKYQDRLNCLDFIRQPVTKKETSVFKPAVLCLKIDLVSHPVRGGGVETI